MNRRDELVVGCPGGRGLATGNYKRASTSTTPRLWKVSMYLYDVDVEPNVPLKDDVVIPVFQRLSLEVGKSRVIWRYDPILVNEKYTMGYHLRHFRALADRLSVLLRERKSEHGSEESLLARPPFATTIWNRDGYRCRQS